MGRQPTDRTSPSPNGDGDVASGRADAATGDAVPGQDEAAEVGPAESGEAETESAESAEAAEAAESGARFAAEQAEAAAEDAGTAADQAEAAADDAANGWGPSADGRFGQPGRPLSRTGPFYIGFVGAIGVLTAWALVRAFASLSQVLTLIVVAAFLAMGLDPVVRALQRRGLRRGAAVAVVFVGVLLAFAGFLAALLPAVIRQATELADQAPDLVDQLLGSRWVRDLDDQYGVVSRLSDELRQRASSGETIASVFGGILGAGKAVISGFFSAFTVLVLTLYFLASLHRIADAGYRLVPATRRERVRLLGDEIIRRIGGYVAGQVSIAAINATLTFLIISILGLPYALVLAIAVGILGLIPMVGASIGAILVVLVGLFQSWKIGAGMAIYYIVYQQIENYIIAPRIMSRTVSVPGAIALIAALAGGSLLGILGALIAIPIAAAVLLIIEEVLLPRQQRT